MPNRLIHSHSPYLLQHAGNPVDWFMWGEEALTRARETDTPIFLSIGYAACHWCHVMEHESFTDPEVAGLLNRYFISIKVDREERPDIDRIYMTACQMMTGSGGWPLSLFLTPDQKPFYAATYIPRNSRQGMPGMTEVVPYLAAVWRDRREEAVHAAGEVHRHLMNLTEAGTPEPERGGSVPDEIIHHAFHHLSGIFDPEYGGFGGPPRFPSVNQLLFLLRYWHWTGNQAAREMVMTTLYAMARGGIRDHIGDGFHRYATDTRWNIPHFEKMLYDQALHARIYTHAYQITGNGYLRRMAVSCLRYMTTTLRQPGGGFASAEDADSRDGEGAFYLWKSEELNALLSPAESALARDIWNIREKGNLPAGTGIPPGSSIPAESPRRAGEPDAGDDREDSPQVRAVRENLFRIREKRPRPALDDKILSDWNGLAIESLATTGLILGEDWILDAGREAAGFLITSLIRPDGSLWHRYRDGVTGVEGMAQDYVFAASGLLALYQATGEARYLTVAISLTTTAITGFTDPGRGGLFATRELDPLVPVRMRDDYDGPVPSVNGHAFRLFTRLAIITGEERFQSAAQSLVGGMIPICRQSPTGCLSLLDELMGSGREIRAVLTGNPGEEMRERLCRALIAPYQPDLIIVPVRPGDPEILPLIPGAREMLTHPSPAVWICADATCLPPVDEPDELKRVLEEIRRS